jgi:predicted dienelactone hydrolase
MLPGAMDLGHAIRDAMADNTSAPYPLVVFSHGYSSWASYYAYMPEHWASYGFVVIAPNHIEGQDAEISFADHWITAIKRPQDIHRTLDYAETLTGPGGDMAGLIDMEQVAAAGHSTGGYTVLAAAGARYDWQSFNQRCEAAAAAGDPNAWICIQFPAGHKADMAALAGFDPMTEGLWPSMGDERVDAIIPMAGDSYIFDQAGLAAITIPVMAMGGTSDTGTPFDWGAKPTYDYASSSQKVLVALKEAEHVIFATNCTDSPWLVEMGFPGMCMDPVWDMDRGHDLINHFTTAFLLDLLKGDTEAAAALAPDQVAFPGITYEAQGF